jgi:ElaB/YqjD/DUF883 family membrane-anchored ribosome-binding protein
MRVVRAGQTADDQSVLRAQIHETRAQLAGILDEIQERLSPANLKQQATETIREATVGKVEKMADSAETKLNTWGSNLMRTVRENPLPVAMIGLGIGWLVKADAGDRNGARGADEAFRRSRAGVPYDRLGTGERYYTSYDEFEFAQDRGRMGDVLEDAAEQTGEMVDRVQDRAGHLAEEVQERAGEVKAKAGEAAADVKDKAAAISADVQQRAGEAAAEVQQRVGEAGTWARQTAGDVQHEAKFRAEQAKATFTDTLHDNPLAVGAVALALGTVVGLLLPSTARENEIMGEKRDQLLEGVKDQAKEAAERVKHVAEEAGAAARDEAAREAERQNLTIPGVTARADEGLSRVTTAGSWTEHQAQMDDESADA